MDHRWGHRVTVDISVRLICQPHAIGVGWLRDLSISGGFVRTTLAPSLLARIHIVDALGADEDAEHEELEAHVVRRGRVGIGVEWTELAPAAVRRILSRPVGSQRFLLSECAARTHR